MTEISRIYSNIDTLKDVKCPYNEQKNINSIALHSNNIKVIEPGILQKFCNLTLLDLSSNQIEKIQGLEKLYNLKTLNLSNNKVNNNSIFIIYINNNNNNNNISYNNDKNNKNNKEYFIILTFI
ncbi:hypothetical protein LY90DRAFT_509315 [Neocallimastix californiae]|uniref:L domain-like protein n=1 Tax=Neocallimastix californiae TaxID=1754190 RepID=A0A1Y2CGX5_9FUNG|nr:hypothetical protein LY90DRAFT_509315 [Neocallimastix californiae]|eukprot:ORY46167.1 hypothetical protein LY90DRAFT_509315 [Neocallimastix californiae]